MPHWTPTQVVYSTKKTCGLGRPVRLGWTELNASSDDERQNRPRVKQAKLTEMRTDVVTLEHTPRDACKRLTDWTSEACVLTRRGALRFFREAECSTLQRDLQCPRDHQTDLAVRSSECEFGCLTDSFEVSSFKTPIPLRANKLTASGMKPHVFSAYPKLQL